MGTIPSFLLVHRVDVRTYRGTTGKGERVFDDAVTGVRCFVDDEVRKVRSSSTGQEVVSQSTVYVRPDAYDLFPPGSEVTLPRGRVAEVITRGDRTSGGLPAPDHVEIMLT